MTYIVHPTRRAIVMPNLPHPGQVLASVHSAREMDWRGHNIVVAPHGVWESQQLRHLGVMVPSPIGYYYDWPRDRTLIPEPFANQRETGGALTLWHRGYCLSEMGVGKTLAGMWAADYLMSQKMIRKVGILAPLSTIERVWGDACFAHFHGRSIAILHGTAKKRNKLLADNDYDFYVINHDALDIICDVETKVIRDKETGIPIGERVIRAELRRDDIDLWMVDELSTYRNGRTKKWRTFKHVLKPKQWAWGFTGTPTPNEPSDAWGQCNLITPWTVPSSFVSFRNMTMQKLTEHVWSPLDESPGIVHRAMQPSIRFTRDQCYDLPPRTWSEREVPLTAEQEKHYKAMARELFTEVNGGAISAVNEGVKRSKLLQIACGVVRDNDGNTRLLDCKPRVQETIDLIEQAAHKVIVFVPYRAPLVMLARELERRFSVALIHGDVSQARRNSIFAEFQTDGGPRVIAADAGCMSHGLTLTRASTIIWYGPEDSNEIYTQANDRITRAGQIWAQHIVHLMSTAVERKVYKRLKERTRMQGILLELAKEGSLS